MTRLFIILCVMYALFSNCSKKVATVEVEKPAEKVIMTFKPEEPQKPVEPVKPMEKIQKTVVVYFEYNSYDLQDSELWKLSNITESVELIGGCCPIGSDDYNYTLGIKRAIAVKNCIETNGAYVKSYTSVGEHDLITENPENYHLNRRCEVRY